MNAELRIYNMVKRVSESNIIDYYNEKKWFQDKSSKELMGMSKQQIYELFLECYYARMSYLYAIDSEMGKVFLCWYVTEGRCCLISFITKIKGTRISKKQLINLFRRYDLIFKMAVLNEDANSLIESLYGLPKKISLI